MAPLVTRVGIHQRSADTCTKPSLSGGFVVSDCLYRLSKPSRGLEPSQLRGPYGHQTHPFQGVYYLYFTCRCCIYTYEQPFMQATRLIRSRAPAGSMTRAGPVSRTGLAPTGENSFDFRGLACIAQTRQDPERGGTLGPVDIRGFSFGDE